MTLVHLLPVGCVPGSEQPHSLLSPECCYLVHLCFLREGRSKINSVVGKTQQQPQQSLHQVFGWTPLSLQWDPNIRLIVPMISTFRKLRSGLSIYCSVYCLFLTHKKIKLMKFLRLLHSIEHNNADKIQDGYEPMLFDINQNDKQE